MVEEIIKIELYPVMSADLPLLQGFFAKAFKTKPFRNEIGFLANCIRSVTIEKKSHNRIRTQLNWLSNEDRMELEERSIHSRAISINQFQIKFHDLDNPVIIKGQPLIAKNTFRGKLVDVNWFHHKQKERTIITIKRSDNKVFSCKLKLKQKTIDIKT
jgi:hypothetical protein